MITLIPIILMMSLFIENVDMLPIGANRIRTSVYDFNSDIVYTYTATDAGPMSFGKSKNFRASCSTDVVLGLITRRSNCGCFKEYTWVEVVGHYTQYYATNSKLNLCANTMHLTLYFGDRSNNVHLYPDGRCTSRGDTWDFCLYDGEYFLQMLIIDQSAFERYIEKQSNLPSVWIIPNSRGICTNDQIEEVNDINLMTSSDQMENTCDYCVSIDLLPVNVKCYDKHYNVPGYCCNINSRLINMTDHVVFYESKYVQFSHVANNFNCHLCLIPEVCSFNSIMDIRISETLWINSYSQNRYHHGNWVIHKLVKVIHMIFGLKY
jgi:hypothetical protein